MILSLENYGFLNLFIYLLLLWRLKDISSDLPFKQKLCFNKLCYL